MSSDARVDEEACRRFEEHRLAGGIDELSSFLPAEDSETFLATLEELVAIELEIRWKAWREGNGQAGDPPSLSDYRGRFPALVDGAVASRLDKEQAWLRQRFRGDAEAVAGMSIGRFQLVARVGRGAFADVWRARDAELARDVAIKIPRVELGADMSRVLREARAAGSLRHPSIVPVHEVVEHDGRPCIVSEFVDGPTLAAVLAEGCKPALEAAALVAQLADALAYAHENGVVHRDVKPGNVLIEPGGRPVLTDFGLAIVGTGDATLTQKGEILGTPAYMAPEQARGARDEVDERSDVYALGAVLYELLTGRRPFDGDSTASVLYAVVHTDPQRPALRLRGVPADLDTICMTAMAKEPGRRYASAGDFAADLRRYLDRRPIVARAPGALGRLVLWARRRPLVAATLVGSAAVIAGVSVVAFLNVVEARDEARSHAYSSLLREAEAHIAGRKTGWRTRTRETIRVAAAMDVAERDARVMRDVLLGVELSPHPSFEPTATFRDSGSRAFALSADASGELVAVGEADGMLRLLDVETGAEVASRRVSEASVGAVAMHPSGAFLLVGTREGELRALTVPDLADTAPGPLGGARVRALTWAPDGEHIAVGRDGSGMEIVHVARSDGTLRLLRSVGDPEAIVRHIAISPDGDRLVAATDEAGVHVIDWVTGETVWSLGIRHPLLTVAFDGDGDRVFFGMEQSLRGETVDLRESATGQLAGSTAAHERELVVLHTDGLGRVISASHDGSIGLSSASGQSLAYARGRFPAIDSAAVADEGRLVVAAYRDGSLRAWRVEDPVVRQTRPGHHEVAFVPGTSRLIHGWGAAIDYDPAGDTRTSPESRIELVAFVPHSGDDGLVVCGTGRVLRVRSTNYDASAVDWATFDDGPTAAGRSRADGPLAVGFRGGRIDVLVGRETGRVLVRHSVPGDEFGTRSGTVHSVAPLGDDGAVLAGIGHRVVALSADGEATRMARAADSTSRSDPLCSAAGRVAVFWCPGGPVTLIDAATLQTIATLDDSPIDVTSLALSTSGDLVAIGRESGHLVLWRPAAGAVESHVIDRGALRRIALSPEGATALLQTVSQLVFVSTDDGRPFAVTNVGGAAGLRWRDDGSVHALFWGNWRPTPFLADELRAAREDPGAEPVTLAPVRRGVRTFRHQIWAVAIAPDGSTFALGDHVGGLRLYDADTLAYVRSLGTDADGELCWTAAFSPDGARLAAGSGASVAVWDLATDEVVHSLEPGEALVVGVSWHPTEPLLAVATLSGRLLLWNPSTDAVTDLPGFASSPPHDVAFSPDGGRLAVARDDGVIAVFDIDPAAVAAGTAPGSARELGEHTAAAWAVAWSPRGTYLASATERGGVVLRDGRTLVALARMQHSALQVRSLAFDDDERLLAVETYAQRSATWDLEALRERLRDVGLDW